MYRCYTLADYTQPNKEDNINTTIHSPYSFEVNEYLNSNEVILTEELQDSPMDVSTSKPCHSLVHFRGPVIMSNLNTFQDNGVFFYDKIVAVCCILSNLNPSILFQ